MQKVRAKNSDILHGVFGRWLAGSDILASPPRIGLVASAGGADQGCVDDRDIFREKASGANRQRTELRRMLDLLRPGDQATFYRLDRLARSQLHLLQIMEEIRARARSSCP